jgi:hypothetical protein
MCVFHPDIRASSVLQKNLKLYGPKNAFDYENTSNCWNSEGSSSGKKECFFIVDFGRMVIPTELRVQFQAGFLAEQVVVLKQKKNGNEYEKMEEFEVEDEHDMQHFLLQDILIDESGATSSIKLVFDEFTDFYARVTIYQLQVWGKEL